MLIAVGRLSEAISLLIHLKDFLKLDDDDLYNEILMISFQFHSIKEDKWTTTPDQKKQTKNKVAWEIIKLLQQIKDEGRSRNFIN